MPNHIHAIIIINAPTPVVETQNFASQKNTIHPNVETQNIASQINTNLQKFGPQSKNLASVVRGFKIGVTKYAIGHDLSFAWQPRFHDHIIRNQYEMNRIGDYISNNVAQWTEDCYHQNANARNTILPEEAYLKYF